MKRHLGDKNGDEELNPLDAHDKRYGKLSTSLFLLFLVLPKGRVVNKRMKSH